MSRLALVLALFLASVALAADNLDQEIDYLLDTVGNSDCVFIRNGSEHDAGSAKDHLSMKRSRGKKYFSTTEEFIDRLASSSSWSGKPYHIRCGDQTELAKDWFMAVLIQYRANPPQPATDTHK